MAKEYLKSRIHLTFTGGESQVIQTASADHFIKITYADIYTAASNTVSIIIGGNYTVCNGVIMDSPSQINFGEGQGKCVPGESAIIYASGACTMDIGIVNVLK
jgi:hypothetical protein